LGEFEGSYTSKRLPVNLVYKAEFSDPNVGIAREKQIKKWSIAKKEALIEGKFDKLIESSKKNFN
jgi:putative endonuclease